MKNAGRSIFEFCDLGDLASQMAHRRNNAEIELTASMVCDPRRAVPIVAAIGINAKSFSEEDLMTIASVAIAVAQHREELTRDEHLELTAQTLKARGWWDDQAPLAPPFSSRWCQENLRKLFGLEYFCRTTIARNARRVLAMEEMRRQAAVHLFRAADLVMGAVACKM